MIATRLCTVVAALCGVLCVAVLARAQDRDVVPARDPGAADLPVTPRLLVGDPAPALAVGEWVKGGPMRIERGGVYVIDFWATWCVPCMQSMPHSSELAGRYRGKGVTFIAVTAGDTNNTLEKVRQVVTDKGEGMDFAVAFDDGRKSTAAFRDAARRGGIPVCFIIDRAGTLAWVGHPMDLDQPLEQIVAGTWDIAPARKAHLEAIEKADLEKRLLRDYEAAQKEQRWEDAIVLAEQIRVLTPRLGFVIGDTFEFLLVKLKDGARATAYAQRCLAELAKDDGPSLGRMARSMASATDAPGRDLSVALRCAMRAAEITGTSNPWSQHSVAVVQMALGEREQAVRWQKRAVEIAGADPESGEFMRAKLREYEQAR